MASPTIPKPPAGYPPYALPDDVFAENQRMARALSRRNGIGDFDRFTTDAINTHGDKAVYEVGDLIRQVRATGPTNCWRKHARASRPPMCGCRHGWGWKWEAIFF